MRFSVECAFPHLRKRGAGSRKTALWPSRLTENRTLQPFLDRGGTKKCILPSHLTEKRTLAQTAQGASRKSAVWSVRGSQNAPFREDPCPECAFP